MEYNPRERWRSFLLAFALTLLLLALIMVGTVMAVQPSMPNTLQKDSANGQQLSYRPNDSDSLTAVVIGMRGSEPVDFVLVRFNPQYGQVPLTMLPPQTLVPLDGKNLTLVQAFETGGSRAVKAALSERLGVMVDRYARVDGDAFQRIVEKTGSVEFELPENISYRRDGYSINLAAGSRRLDARDMFDLFAYPAFRRDQEARCGLLGRMLAAWINQNLDAAGEERSSSLFKLTVNLVDTDISYADYEPRRRAANFLSQLDAQVAGSLPVSGTWLGDGASFELSESYVNLVRQYFQAIG